MFDDGRRKFDARGRICIPKKIRDVFDLKNSVVDIFTENDLIIICKASVHAEDFSAARTSTRKTRGTSVCNRCLCSSCNGFRCPWAFGFVGRTKTDGTLPDRCFKCGNVAQELIRDCDFYTNKKSKKFYRYRPKMKKTKWQIFLEEVRGEFKEFKKIMKGEKK
jgi:AbrB family looped-hinge helix DNA binding protein